MNLTGTLEPIPQDAPRLYDWNRAYFCPVCGQVWARWELHPGYLWSFVSRSCAAHRAYSHEHPGSLIVDRLDLLLLPQDQLIREALL